MKAAIHRIARLFLHQKNKLAKALCLTFTKSGNTLNMNIYSYKHI